MLISLIRRYFCAGELNERNKLSESKIQRMFVKYGEQLAAENLDSATEIVCLMFDGRKDETLTTTVLSDREGAVIKEKVKQEHIVVVEEPNSEYRTHFTPTSGKAIDIAEGLLNFIETSNSLDSLNVIGADGTATNTGCHNGVIRKLEEHLGRPLQWAICQLHLTELPFRHLFSLIDGKTTGPHSYRGEIGQLIMENNTELKMMPIVKFQTVKGRFKQLPSEVINDFTGDQLYFYKMLFAVRSGVVSLQLSLWNPGALCEARWLTKANRILRLYVSTLNPSEQLKRYIFLLILNID
jgi:hypothetical protein